MKNQIHTVQATNETIRIATTLSEIEAWGPAYEDFLDAVGKYGIFYEKGWFSALWAAYSQKPGTLFFISVWDGGSIVALAPLQLLQKGVLQGRRKVLEFLGTHHPTLVNPLPEILVRSEAVRERGLKAFGEALKQNGKYWDQVDLNLWPINSPNIPVLEKQWSDADFSVHLNRSAQIDLDDGFETYESTLSRNSRSQLRRARKRLLRETNAEFHCTTELSAQRWEAISRMHRKRQEKLREKGQADRYSIFTNGIETKALHEALIWAQSIGRTRHYWLDIDGVTSAFCLGLHQGGSYFYYFVGMDELAEPYSGGMVLLHHLIEQEARRGTRCIDMMAGVNRVKTRFATRIIPLYQCYYDNKRLVSTARNTWVGFVKKVTGRVPPPGTHEPTRVWPGTA